MPYQNDFGSNYQGRVEEGSLTDQELYVNSV